MYNRFPEDTAKELTNDIIRAGMEEKGIGEFADEIVGKREPEPGDSGGAGSRRPKTGPGARWGRFSARRRLQG